VSIAATPERPTAPTLRLGDVAEIIMGQAPPGEACNKEGRGKIFVKAGEFAERYPIICEWTTRPLKLAQSGDVLVCVVGATAGKINQAIDCASVARSRLFVRRPNCSRNTYIFF
jgi:type I restriction enzyme S subunit